MTRTTVVLPASLRSRAKRIAAAEGVSFGEFTRRALARVVEERERLERDPLFVEVPYPRGVKRGRGKDAPRIDRVLHEARKRRWSS